MFGQSFNIDAIKFVFTIIRNPNLLVPKLQVGDIRQISFPQLKESGIKAIAFDKDNTLTAPYQSHVYQPFQASFTDAKAIFGDNLCIISNSAGSKDDVGYKHADELELALGIAVLRSKFKKPSLELGGELLKHFGLKADQIAVVGDRLITDMVYANRIGAYSIYCRNIITKDGDNKIAALIRSLEHSIIDRYNNKWYN